MPAERARPRFDRPSRSALRRRRTRRGAVDVQRPLVDPTAEALAGLSADGTRRILVGHGQVDEIAPDLPVSAIRLSALETALDDGRLHYVALGDRHSRLSLGETGRVQYSGSPEVTSFRDQVPGDVLVVDLDAGAKCGWTTSMSGVGPSVT